MTWRRRARAWLGADEGEADGEGPDRAGQPVPDGEPAESRPAEGPFAGEADTASPGEPERPDDRPPADPAWREPPRGPARADDRSSRESVRSDDSGAGSRAAARALEELVPEVAQATVVCLANQKGGVGKTTTTVSLGAALATEGAQVLVIDLDPQGNATTGLGLRVPEGSPSTYRVLIDELPVEDAAEPTAVRGLHVIPSSLDLAGAEIELVSLFSRESRLREALADVRELYDVVLIDCPPSLGLLTVNALVAADQVVVPIQCEYYALEGLGQLMRTIQLVHDGLNEDLRIGGVVLTMYDARTNLSEQVAGEVRDYFGELAFETVVPRTVRLSEAPSYGQPITVFDPSSRGARAYRRLADEVGGRLGLAAADDSADDALDRLLGSDTAVEPDAVGDPDQVPTSIGSEDREPDGAEAGPNRPGDGGRSAGDDGGAAPPAPPDTEDRQEQEP